MKKYSIIIPTLNEAGTLYDFLVALQAFRNQCEIIIVDGGSVDNTNLISLPLVDRFISAPKGRAKQMNKGARIASTDIFIFLHADTFLPKRALLLIQQAINSSAKWGRFNIQLVGQHPILKVVALMMNWRSRLTGIATGDQGIFMTRCAFQVVGGFPDIPLMEDIEMSKRLKVITRPYCINAKVKSSARRWEALGVWKTIALMWNIRLRYFLGQSPIELVELYNKGIFWRR